MALFGLTVAAITANIHGVSITATTSPSTADVESWIDMYSGIASGIFESKGIDPSTLDSGSSGYSYGRDVVMRYTVARTLMSVQGRFDHAQVEEASADKALRRLETWAGVIGSSALSAEGSVDMPLHSASQTMQEAIAQRVDSATTNSLRNRMVRLRMM
jgi:hypothetical protein